MRPCGAMPRRGARREQVSTRGDSFSGDTGDGLQCRRLRFGLLVMTRWVRGPSGFQARSGTRGGAADAAATLLHPMYGYRVVAMNRRIARVASAVILMVGGLWGSAQAAGPAFKVSAEGFPAGGTVAGAQVFNGFGCQGENQSPLIRWENPPAGTQSFALTIYDPDAPTGSGFWHWVVFDIPDSATGLGEGAASGVKATLPLGTIQGHTDFGAKTYGGPCPPPGAKPHRYVVTLYALKVPTLSLPADATGALVSYMARANALGKATVTATYGRPTAPAKTR